MQKEFLEQEKLAYFFGLMIGDGYIRKTKSRNYMLCIGTTQLSLIIVAKEAMEALGLKTYLYQKEKTRKFPNGAIYTGLTYTLIANSKELYTILRECKLKDYYWKIPKICISKKMLLAFLQGLFDAEGYVGTNIPNKKSNKKYCYITLTSKHQENLQQIQDILKTFEISGKIYKGSKGNFYALYIIDGPSINNFKSLIGFRLPHKKEALSKFKSQYENDWIKRPKTKDELVSLIVEQILSLKKEKCKVVSRIKICKKLNIAPMSLRRWYRKMELNFKRDIEEPMQDFICFSKSGKRKA